MCVCVFVWLYSANLCTLRDIFVFIPFKCYTQIEAACKNCQNNKNLEESFISFKLRLQISLTLKFSFTNLAGNISAKFKKYFIMFIRHLNDKIFRRPSICFRS